MNKVKLTWTLVLMATASIFLPSCLDDGDSDYATVFPNALVTLKNDPANERFYIQLDDSTTLFPTNIVKSPYGNKEIRALINFSQENSTKRNQTYDVHVNWIDTIRTKPMDISLGKENNITAYGNDPLEIINDWTTIVEDGYLTLRFCTYFGMGKIHYLRLVKGDSPFEVVLYHDADNDCHGQMAEGLIAFRLNDLPDTGEETVDLTLKWNSFSGEKSTKFKYRTRR